MTRAGQYKIGDKVKLKSLEWYDQNKNEEGNVIINGLEYDWELVFTKNDSQYCGQVFTISDISCDCENCYLFTEMTNGYYYCDEMIECKVKNNI
jgi:hypothetical protein